MIRLFAYLMVVLLTTASLTYVQRSNPEMLDKLVLRIDVFGITEAAAQEKDRLAQIHRLQMPYEQKKVLMERTVFIGATNQMVYLALGTPESASKYRGPETQNSAKIVQRWVYYFKGDQRPTVLQFEDDILVSAFKGSKVDLSEQSAETAK